jgi:PAS domain S-box-containing protein
MNRVAEELTGWAAQDALGRHVDVVFRLRDEQTRQVVASPVAHVLRQGEIFHLADHLVLITRQGCEEPIANSVAPIRSGKDTIQGAVIICRTIAERRRLEEQLRQAQKMQAIGTLAGGIARDFNNLLAAILGYTELAVSDLSSCSPSWSCLQQVLQVGTRARDLVQQILTFSRRAQAERTPLQLHTLVKEALLLLRTSLPSTIEIRPRLDPHSGAVLADATQLHQILVNLCANSEHAMRQRGGLLEVSLEPVEVDATLAATHLDLCPGSYVRLTVRDTGHGMPPEVVERLCEPFFTTKDVGEGTGLGLSIVHGIVMSHGGAI